MCGGHMITNTKLETQNYDKVTVTPRFCYFTSKADNQSTLEREASYSLSRKRKFIHPKFFYDKTGSDLFEQICLLPEYYLTRTEMKILHDITNELPNYLKGNYALVELGSGSSTKTRKLLEALSSIQNQIEYYPIDISDILKDSSTSLHDEYDNLKITGIIDQYEPALEFIKHIDHQKKIIAFLGSSLGNFEPEQALEFLSSIHKCMQKNDLLLLGLDLVKDTKILEKAYNDSKGITAKFNLNLLSRINKELQASFDIKKFEHLAKFNKNQSRIEMYLRSKVNQEVYITSTGFSLKFKKDELISTEYSYKYDIPQIKEMAQKTGFNLQKMWTDKKNHFALALLSLREL